MPLFEYVCDNCRKRYSVLIGMTATADTQACPYCHAPQGTKRVSRFAKGRGDDALLDDLSDPDKIGDMDDPKVMRQWAKQMGKEMGEDLGDEFDEYLDSAEHDTDFDGTEALDEEA